MLPYNSWVSRVAFGIFFIILIGYGYFEARGILYGPQIQVPDTVAPVHESFVRIRGTALHIASLAMNGKQIAVTEAGEFNEPYLLAPGTNRIVLEAKDKYGNSTQRALLIVYVPRDLPPTAPYAASTTPDRTTKATTTPADTISSSTPATTTSSE